MQDDVLATRLTPNFDFVPSGWLFLKTFSHLQPGTEGPHRFAPEDIRQLFADNERFEVIEISYTVYQGQLDPFPKALFSVIRRR
jgi:hypothetical protein